MCKSKGTWPVSSGNDFLTWVCPTPQTPLGTSHITCTPLCPVCAEVRPGDKAPPIAEQRVGGFESAPVLVFVCMGFLHGQIY